MTRAELYELEADVNKNIDRIKKEQAEYLKGVEHGIELMFKAVRERLAKEEDAAYKARIAAKEIKNCINCNRGKKSPLCKECKSTYDRKTDTSTTPTHWEPLSGPMKESEGTE